ncbi:MAG: formylglycine-generating enzyme family protein [Marivita sp.]
MAAWPAAFDHDAEGTICLAGGRFVMGSDHHYPEEKPTRAVSVAAFAIDRHAITNAQFARFVEDTGYVTTAERERPGALVFQMTEGPVSLTDPSRWWRFVDSACWRAPEGDDSGIAGRMDHPVVQVSHEDAEAYAAWAGTRLPTEAEWEFAASLAFDMNEVLSTANIWRGAFPHQNNSRTMAPFTVPVGSGTGHPGLPENMLGNVWEWTSSPFHATARAGCCSGTNEGPAPDVRVLKGGSFLCAKSYCRRYRPQARIGQTLDYATNHIGFRCARDMPEEAILNEECRSKKAMDDKMREIPL